MGCNSIAKLQPGLPIRRSRPFLVRRWSHNPDHPLWNPGSSNQDESALSTYSPGDCACPLGKHSPSGLLLLLLSDQHHCECYADPWRSGCDDSPHWHEHYCGKLRNLMQFHLTDATAKVGTRSNRCQSMDQSMHIYLIFWKARLMTTVPALLTSAACCSG